MHGTQDGGIGGIGTIIKLFDYLGGCACLVEWDIGIQSHYCIGAANRFELVHHDEEWGRISAQLEQAQSDQLRRLQASLREYERLEQEVDLGTQAQLLLRDRIRKESEEVAEWRNECCTWERLYEGRRLKRLAEEEEKEEESQGERKMQVSAKSDLEEAESLRSEVGFWTRKAERAEQELKAVAELRFECAMWKLKAEQTEREHLDLGSPQLEQSQSDQAWRLQASLRDCEKLEQEAELATKAQMLLRETVRRESEEVAAWRSECSTWERLCLHEGGVLKRLAEEESQGQSKIQMSAKRDLEEVAALRSEVGFWKRKAERAEQDMKTVAELRFECTTWKLKSEQAERDRLGAVQIAD